MKLNKRIIVWGIIALFVVYAVNATEILVNGVESDNDVLTFISKLAYSISTINIVDLMTCFGVFALISYVYKEESFKFDIAGGIVSVILSFLYIWCFSYKFTKDTSALFENPFQVFLTIFRLCGFIILFYVGFAFLCKCLEKCKIEKNNKRFRVFFISAVIVFAGWLFWIIMAYPGTVSGDGVTQLRQYYFNAFSAHHPPFSTWIMGKLFDIGFLLTQDGRFGVFLYLFFQTVCGALIIGYCIYTMYQFGIYKGVCYFTAVIFGITPVFGMFAQWYEKDLLYSLFTLLFLTNLSKMCLDKVTVKGTIELSIIAIICIFLRNNGIFAVIPAMLLLVLVAKGRMLRSVIIGCCAGTIAITLVVTGPVYSAMNIAPTNIREALSIPMQQSARYITFCGDEITEEEKDTLGLFFNDYNNIPNIYEAFCSDPVKDTVIIEKKDLLRYFVTWIRMGLKHPEVYFDAFMCLNYGYLAPTEQNAEANGDMPNQEHDVIMFQLSEMGIDGVQSEVNIQILKSLIFMNIVFPLLRYLSMPGVYMWFIIVAVAIFIKLHYRKSYIILVPNIINLLVCLASPLCNGMRYELPVVLSVPLILSVMVVLFNQKNSKEKLENSYI